MLTMPGPISELRADGAVAERAAGGIAIDERVGVEVARPRALVGRQAPVVAGRIGIADAAAVLDRAAAALRR